MYLNTEFPTTTTFYVHWRLKDIIYFSPPQKLRVYVKGHDYLV